MLSMHIQLGSHVPACHGAVTDTGMDAFSAAVYVGVARSARSPTHTAQKLLAVAVGEGGEEIKSNLCVSNHHVRLMSLPLVLVVACCRRVLASLSWLQTVLFWQYSL